MLDDLLNAHTEYLPRLNKLLQVVAMRLEGKYPYGVYNKIDGHANRYGHASAPGYITHTCQYFLFSSSGRVLHNSNCSLRRFMAPLLSLTHSSIVPPVLLIIRLNSHRSGFTSVAAASPSNVKTSRTSAKKFYKCPF